MQCIVDGSINHTGMSAATPDRCVVLDWECTIKEIFKWGSMRFDGCLVRYKFDILEFRYKYSDNHDF